MSKEPTDMNQGEPGLSRTKQQARAELGNISTYLFDKLAGELAEEIPDGLTYHDRQGNRLSEKAKGSTTRVSDELIVAMRARLAEKDSGEGLTMTQMHIRLGCSPDTLRPLMENNPAGSDEVFTRRTVVGGQTTHHYTEGYFARIQAAYERGTDQYRAGNTRTSEATKRPAAELGAEQKRIFLEKINKIINRLNELFLKQNEVSDRTIGIQLFVKSKDILQRLRGTSIKLGRPRKSGEEFLTEAGLSALESEGNALITRWEIALEE